jgi:hypothetical protein
VDEKKIIIKIQYLWLLCGILYIVPFVIFLKWLITYGSKGLEGAFSQYGISVFTVLIANMIMPIMLYMGFMGISIILLYLLKQEKEVAIKLSILIALVSLIIFGVGSLYYRGPIFVSIPDYGLLFLIIIAIILIFNMLIIYLSLKSECKEFPT